METVRYDELKSKSEGQNAPTLYLIYGLCEKLHDFNPLETELWILNILCPLMVNLLITHDALRSKHFLEFWVTVMAIHFEGGLSKPVPTQTKIFTSYRAKLKLKPSWALHTLLFSILHYYLFSYFIFLCLYSYEQQQVQMLWTI